jgi:gamma-glutamyltranspeptidase
VPAQTATRLAEMGHPIIPNVSGYERARFGRGQIIRVEPAGLSAGSDARADGCAIEE